jgi:hypothetical protein
MAIVWNVIIFWRRVDIHQKGNVSMRVLYSLCALAEKSSPAALLELTSHIVSPPSFGAAHRFRKDQLTS